jgi:hypothetical protein
MSEDTYTYISRRIPEKTLSDLRLALETNLVNTENPECKGHTPVTPMSKTALEPEPQEQFGASLEPEPQEASLEPEVEIDGKIIGEDKAFGKLILRSVKENGSTHENNELRILRERAISLNVSTETDSKILKKEAQLISITPSTNFILADTNSIPKKEDFLTKKPKADQETMPTSCCVML